MKKLEGVYVADSLENVGEYAKLGPGFEKAVAFLRRPDLKKLPNGRYELDGENAYAMVQEATLKPWGTGRPEVHHEYFDIQIPLSGEVHQPVADLFGVGRTMRNCAHFLKKMKDTLRFQMFQNGHIEISFSDFMD